MLLIRELSRLARDMATFVVGTRRVGLVLLILVIGVVVVLSATVTTLGPVALYPFL